MSVVDTKLEAKALELISMICLRAHERNIYLLKSLGRGGKKDLVRNDEAERLLTYIYV